MYKNEFARTTVRSGASPDLCDVPCFEEEVVRRVRLSQPDEGTLEETRKIFALLADRNRLLILHALQTGRELCVCDLAHVLDTSVATASHHLRRLRDLGLLATRRQGKLVLYSLSTSWVADMTGQALKEVGRA